MTGGPAVVIGVGNPYRRDDGIGPAAIAELQDLCSADVLLTVADGEPTQLLDAWAGARLAVVIDAVRCQPASPGRIHRSTLGQLGPGDGSASTHGLGIPDAVRLAQVLERVPDRLVVYAVEAADLGFGLGLSPAVAAAVPELVRAVLAELALTSSPDGG
ncbi:MAG TPA: hydrogenase maturation protease [Jatrophihabitans sp.]|jgi:hydrogenase maturation protease|nr:hydrogenase maturation protease [Jatrophihabitans sp.]